MDENKQADMGELNDLDAIGGTPGGETFSVNDTPPQEGARSYETIASNFEMVHPINHGAAEYLGTTPLGMTQYDTVNGPVPMMATMVSRPHPVVMASPRPPARLMPIALFFITCLTTLAAGTSAVALKSLAIFVARGQLPAGVTWSMVGDGLFYGFQYAGPLMLILLCHEMGHYVQAWRNRIPASLPYFIPVPFKPLGTMGAVIGMRSNLGDRRSLFDIGITGPLAGLVPTLIFLFIGLHYSEVGYATSGQITLGEPLLMKGIIHLEFGSIPKGQEVLLHPMAFAAWVGLLITSLNLIPIGQLDGGHVLHALMPKKSGYVAQSLLFTAVLVSVWSGYTVWALMIILLFIMGPKHPPTADDRTPIGLFRVILGWLTLAFILIGFNPMPIQGM